MLSRNLLQANLPEELHRFIQEGASSPAKRAAAADVYYAYTESPEIRYVAMVSGKLASRWRDEVRLRVRMVLGAGGAVRVPRRTVGYITAAKKLIAELISLFNVYSVVDLLVTPAYRSTSYAESTLSRIIHSVLGDGVLYKPVPGNPFKVRIHASAVGVTEEVTIDTGKLKDLEGQGLFMETIKRFVANELFNKSRAIHFLTSQYYIVESPDKALVYSRGTRVVAGWGDAWSVFEALVSPETRGKLLIINNADSRSSHLVRMFRRLAGRHGYGYPEAEEVTALGSTSVYARFTGGTRSVTVYKSPKGYIIPIPALTVERWGRVSAKAFITNRVQEVYEYALIAATFQGRHYTRIRNHILAEAERSGYTVSRTAVELSKAVLRTVTSAKNAGARIDIDTTGPTISDVVVYAGIVTPSVIVTPFIGGKFTAERLDEDAAALVDAAPGDRGVVECCGGKYSRLFFDIVRKVGRRRHVELYTTYFKGEEAIMAKIGDVAILALKVK